MLVREAFRVAQEERPGPIPLRAPASQTTDRAEVVRGGQPTPAGKTPTGVGRLIEQETNSMIQQNNQPW
jgi:hypothetical protein